MQTRYATITEMLQQAAEQAPSGAGYTYLADSGATTLSFAALWQDASDMAGALQNHGLVPGDRVIVALPTGPFFARLYTLRRCPPRRLRVILPEAHQIGLVVIHT